MSDPTSDPLEFFRSVAAKHQRCFWLDGGGAREWSGRRSIIGWLDEDDVSLSWSAARREVTLHAAGVSTVVGDDVFAVLEDRVAAGEQWFGYLGYAARTDLPATPGCAGQPEGHYCAQTAPESLHQRSVFFASAVTGVPVIIDPFADPAPAALRAVSDEPPAK